MKDSECKAWTDFVRKREQAPKRNERDMIHGSPKPNY